MRLEMDYSKNSFGESEHISQKCIKLLQITVFICIPQSASHYIAEKMRYFKTYFWPKLHLGDVYVVNYQKVENFIFGVIFGMRTDLI